MKYFIHGDELRKISSLSDADSWLNASFSTINSGGICWIDTRESNWQKVVRDVVAVEISPVVVSYQPDIKEMQGSLLLGARAYCNATEVFRHCEAISQAITAGGLWIPGGLVTAMFHRLSEHPGYTLREDSGEVLTEREREILQLLLKGESNQQMSETLNITVRTVKEHMSSILKKYRVKDRVALLLKIGRFNSAPQ
ncbi:response regulator transcription factor [Alteromonas confluentis]|uniref:HTH luxR-type domain-containing protein n=1 Tax=Alteromonas confluentis TaxID=1656094 RepID=A0A1E7Z6J6_9ALTE|nr:response regulator transcription factor [Alteromonas confluentis]OFC69179.1 hypothetical protein BFC18_20855 [Alteromonas confluentis]